MKIGTNFIIFARLFGVNPSTVDSIIFTFKGKNFVTKTYPGDVTFTNNMFNIPFYQEDTIHMLGNIKGEAQINYKTGSVSKTDIIDINLDDSIHTEIIEGNTPGTTTFTEVEFNVIGESIIAEIKGYTNPFKITENDTITDSVDGDMLVLDYPNYNLFNLNDYIIGAYSSTTGEYTISSITAQSSICTKNKINVVPGEKYHIKCVSPITTTNFLFYSENGEYLGNYSDNDNPLNYIVEIPNDCYKINIYLRRGSIIVTDINDFKNYEIMLIKGDIDRPFNLPITSLSNKNHMVNTEVHNVTLATNTLGESQSSTTLKCYIKANTTYVISVNSDIDFTVFRVATMSVDEIGVQFTSKVSHNDNTPIIITSGDADIVMYIQLSNSVFEDIKDLVQVEEDVESTDFTQGKGSTIFVNSNMLLPLGGLMVYEDFTKIVCNENVKVMYPSDEVSKYIIKSIANSNNANAQSLTSVANLQSVNKVSMLNNVSRETLSETLGSEVINGSEIL